MQRQMEVRMIELDKIRPSPFQPRESFPKDEIQQLANTIKAVGLLQPIAVRKQGDTYQIISGERRWRAAQFAGLKAIPAIVKDVSDSQMMIESLIENVQRKDLEPIERGRGLAEVYRLEGFEPSKVMKQLSMIEDVISGRVERKITDEEKKVKEIADLVGLSYDYQYRLLTQLRLAPEEQSRVSELELGYEEISSIATIDRPEIRKKVIEMAPELKRSEIKTLSKVVKKATESIVQAVLKPESKVTPKVAEKLMEIHEEAKQKEVIKQIETLRLTEEEAMAQIETTKTEPTLPQKQGYLTLEEPLPVQYQHQREWNLKQLIGRQLSWGKFKFDFITIGYSQKTVQDLITLLKLAEVTILIDVRRNPSSLYKPEFNKDELAKELPNIGIKYVHIPELGISREARDEMYEGAVTPKELLDQYERQILGTRGLDQLFEIVKGKGTFALMCTEVDPTMCHRHKIAEVLVKKGMIGYDL